MIFVLFPIKLWFFKNKFFIEQRRHLKRISDGEYMCDKISCLRTYFHNFWRCYNLHLHTWSKNTEKKSQCFLRIVSSHPPSCQLAEADFICSTERKMTKRWVRTVNIAAVIAEGVWCESKLRLRHDSVLPAPQPFFLSTPFTWPSPLAISVLYPVVPQEAPPIRDLMYYRGTGFLAVVWVWPLPPPLPPISHQQVVSLSQTSCVSPVVLLTDGERGRSQIRRPRENLVLYYTLNTLWPHLWPPHTHPIYEFPVWAAHKAIPPPLTGETILPGGGGGGGTVSCLP